MATRHAAVHREFWASALESIVYRSKSVDTATAAELGRLAEMIREGKPDMWHGKLLNACRVCGEDQTVMATDNHGQTYVGCARCSVAPHS